MSCEFAWAAGFFDGEGYICARRGERRKSDPSRITYTQIILDIAQKDRRVLDRFAQIMGVGRVYGPYRNGLAGGNATRCAFRYMLTKSSHVQDVVAKMRPWLSPVKIKQCDEAINFWLKMPRLKSGRKAGLSTCHPDKKHAAKGLCGSCYNRSRPKSKLRRVK